VTTEPDRHEPGPFASLVGCSRKRAHVRRPSPFDFGGSHGANAPLRVACGWSAGRGPKAPRRSGAPPSAQSCAAGARLRSDEPRDNSKLNWIQFKLIWNCVVKVP